jgi:hypothetical protein
MPEEGLKVDRFAGVLPEQLLTEASLRRDAVVSADQRAVTRCLRRSRRIRSRFFSCPSVLLFATVERSKTLAMMASPVLRRQVGTEQQ